MPARSKGTVVSKHNDGSSIFVEYLDGFTRQTPKMYLANLNEQQAMTPSQEEKDRIWRAVVSSQ